MDNKAYQILMQLKPKPLEYVIREENYNCFLVKPLSSSEIFSFNYMAGEVLRRIDGKRNVGEIIDSLHVDYAEISKEEIGIDIFYICAKFAEKNIITFRKYK